MSLDEGYKLNVERRLASLETSLNDLKEMVGINAKSVAALEKTVARLSVIMPLFSGLTFVIGYLLH